jgi:hypothetical protein
MKEFDDTEPPKEPNTECIDSYSRKRIKDFAERIAALEAALADLHNDRAQRLQQQDLEDPEWY